MENSEGVKRGKVRWAVESRILRIVQLYELMFALILLLAALHSIVLFCGTNHSLKSSLKSSLTSSPKYHPSNTKTPVSALDTISD